VGVTASPDVHPTGAVLRAVPDSVGAADTASTPATAGHSIFDYRHFSPFCWEWSWRRSLVFGIFAGTFAIWEGVALGVLADDRRIGLAAAAVGVPLWLTLVSAGPLLAAWVRSRGWSLERERLGVVLAVVLGVAVGLGGQWLANLFNRGILLPVMIRHGVFGSSYLAGVESLGRYRALWIGESLLFFIFSGALALRSYFGEQRRLVQEAREREVSGLQLRQRQADLQLLVLQAQIEPHFLFNTLASLRSLLRQDVGRAEAMVDALVEHLRATVPILRQRPAASTLAEQLRICGSYLELMQVRLPDRLSYSISAPESLRGSAFPPLILLTLVENAVKHGIEPKPRAGHIRIDAALEQRSDGARVVVSVADDGVGLAAGLGHGMGLSNIRAQLALKYGERAALSISGRAHGGTVARIEIPEEPAVP
jgi:signal transduction histidine kinase